MRMKNLMVMAGLAGCILLIPNETKASIISGLTQPAFSSSTVERFRRTFVTRTSYNFGNGMIYSNLAGSSDYINWKEGYGMGTEPDISFGLGGSGDGYFCTKSTPTTFEFAFSDGITMFGFYGAESVLAGSQLHNGILDISFYDLNNSLIDTISEPTAGAFAWDQFHGFESDSGAIGRVVFDNVAHMVLDNVSFEVIPEPASAGLIGLFTGGIFFTRRFFVV